MKVHGLYKGYIRVIPYILYSSIRVYPSFPMCVCLYVYMWALRNYMNEYKLIINNWDYLIITATGRIEIGLIDTCIECSLLTLTSFMRIVVNDDFINITSSGRCVVDIDMLDEFIKDAMNE